MQFTKMQLHTLLTAFALPLIAGGAHAQKLSVQEVPLTANHVLYDSINGKVYASIPGTAALNPNTVAQINAATGAVEAYIPVAGGPDVLALSSDGSYLYVGTDTTSTVSRLNLSTSTVDQQFSLGTSSIPSYSYHAGNIVPLPGMPQSVAVTRDYFEVSPSNDGVAVYDNGVQRPTVLPRYAYIYPLLIGSSSPNRLYSFDNETTALTFAQLNVDANGVTVAQTSGNTNGVLRQTTARIKFNAGNGLVYATNGTVVDPVALTDVGMYPSLALDNNFPSSVVDVVPNTPENRVYFLAGPANTGYFGSATLAAYNLTAFQSVSSFSTSATYSSVGDLYEVSASKFVFLSNQGVEFATPQTVTSIAVTATTPSVAAGKTDQFTATGTYPDGSTSDLTGLVAWSSDNTNAATISSAGLATGIASGTANVTASLNGVASSPFALTVTAAQYNVLWNNSNGQASIWNYDADNGTFTQNTFGPYPGWTAKAIADSSADGLTRVLWDNTSGAASLWSLDNLAGTFSQFTYGPYSGWTANALDVNIGAAALGSATSPNSLLWNNPNGLASLWTQNTDYFGSFTQSTFGPFSGWSATGVACGPDGNTQVLWDNADGSMSVGFAANSPYDLPSPLNQAIFGPYPGWTANAISIGSDDTTHVLWTNTNGTMSLWNYDITFGTFTFQNYGPYPGWTAKAIADGSDGKTVVLWDNTDGHASIWSLNNVTGVFTQYTFGPYPGWTAAAVSGGN